MLLLEALPNKNNMTNLVDYAQEWKPVKGFEGYYEISNYGNIRSVDRYVNHYSSSQYLVKGQDLVINYCQDYGRIRLCKESIYTGFLVHVIVATHFIGDIPEGHEVNHKDLNKRNCYVHNLEITTKAYNYEHALKAHGGFFSYPPKSLIGFKGGSLIVETFDSISEAARLTGIDKRDVSSVLRGRQKTTKGYYFLKLEA